MKNNNSVGLVFSGGGGKGSYEIGVWRALDEYGVSPNVSAVSGASVGALNAALFAQGDRALAEDLWLNMTEGDILHRAPEKLIIKLAAFLPTLGLSPLRITAFIQLLHSSGVFSRQGLLDLIDKNIDAQKVTSGALSVFATCRQSGISKRIKHFSLAGADTARMKSILLASSAVPFIFPSEEIDGETWSDGGFPNINGSNTPIQPVYESGCKFIISVLLDMDDLVDRFQFEDAQIIFIYPQESNGELLSGSFDYDGSHAKLRMDQGYKDTIRILEPIYRMGKAQVRYSNALEVIRQQEENFVKIRRKIADRHKQMAIHRAATISLIDEIGPSARKEISANKDNILSDI